MSLPLIIPSSHSFNLLMQALFLNCPELKDLNLNLCSNLHPESLVLQCPKLQLVYASGCQDLLTGAIRKQVIPWTYYVMCRGGSNLVYCLVSIWFYTNRDQINSL